MATGGTTTKKTGAPTKDVNWLMSANDGSEFASRLHQLGVKVPGMNSNGAIDWSAKLPQLIGAMDETARAVLWPFAQWAVDKDGKPTAGGGDTLAKVRIRLQQLQPELKRMQDRRSDAAVIARVRQEVAAMESAAGTTVESPAGHSPLSSMGGLLSPLILLDVASEYFGRSGANAAAEVADIAVHAVRPDYLDPAVIRRQSKLAGGIVVIFGTAAFLLLLAMGADWIGALVVTALVLAAFLWGAVKFSVWAIGRLKNELLPFLDRDAWKRRLYEQVRVTTRLLGFANLQRVVDLGLIPEIIRAVDVEQRKEGLQYKLFDEDADVVIEELFREYPTLSVMDVEAWKRAAKGQKLSQGTGTTKKPFLAR
jgi:hypothetical protein